MTHSLPFMESMIQFLILIVVVTNLIIKIVEYLRTANALKEIFTALRMIREHGQLNVSDHERTREVLGKIEDKATTPAVTNLVLPVPTPVKLVLESPKDGEPQPPSPATTPEKQP